MEIEMQANNKDTLMHGLTAWNRTENIFREVFNEEALKDRDYLKMKLAEYDRLHYRHGGNIRTTDERALMNMLRFQRRKIERTLYPGLLTRALRRMVSFLSSPINAEREMEMAKQFGMQPYLDSQLPVKEPIARQEQKENPQQNQSAPDTRQSDRPRHHEAHRPHKRQSKSTGRGSKKGPSM